MPVQTCPELSIFILAQMFKSALKHSYKILSKISPKLSYLPALSFVQSIFRLSLHIVQVRRSLKYFILFLFPQTGFLHFRPSLSDPLRPGVRLVSSGDLPAQSDKFSSPSEFTPITAAVIGKQPEYSAPIGQYWSRDLNTSPLLVNISKAGEPIKIHPLFKACRYDLWGN